jgi:uncharacterized protein
VNIQKTYPFAKKENDSLYRRSDEFSLFYFRFMEKSSGHSVERDSWLAISGSPSYLNWCGYAFENICIKHVSQIKKALGIAGIRTVEGSWYRAGTKKEGAVDLENTLSIFRQETNTDKTIFMTFLTTYGVLENDYKTQRVDVEETMKDLYA